jgi:hypothetical protein
MGRIRLVSATGPILLHANDQWSEFSRSLCGGQSERAVSRDTISVAQWIHGSGERLEAPGCSSNVRGRSVTGHGAGSFSFPREPRACEGIVMRGGASLVAARPATGTPRPLIRSEGTLSETFFHEK